MQTNKIANRQIICEVLIESATKDKEIVVLCSDSRGSASLGAFAETLPSQFVEVGIAEQNLVSVAAGLANGGKRPFVASPACFLTTRSFEQVKVDVAYSGANVKLIGISGGISYGALGMTHHSAQDIAALSAVPGMRVYLPSDRHQTRKLFEVLVQDATPAYIRVGRNAVEDIYNADDTFVMDRATLLQQGKDVAIIACGEMVRSALDAAALLAADGIDAAVLDMFCVKPIDREAVVRAAQSTNLVLTVEEHSCYGGMGAMVSQIVAAQCSTRVINLALPDEPVIAGVSHEVLHHYGLDAAGIFQTIKEAIGSA